MLSIGHLEFATTDLSVSNQLFSQAFGWKPEQPAAESDAAAPVTVVAPTAFGVSVLPVSAADQVRTTPFLAVDSLSSAMEKITEGGGEALGDAIEFGDLTLQRFKGPGGFVAGICAKKAPASKKRKAAPESSVEPGQLGSVRALDITVSDLDAVKTFVTSVFGKVDFEDEGEACVATKAGDVAVTFHADATTSAAGTRAQIVVSNISELEANENLKTAGVSVDKAVDNFAALQLAALGQVGVWEANTASPAKKAKSDEDNDEDMEDAQEGDEEQQPAEPETQQDEEQEAASQTEAAADAAAAAADDESKPEADADEDNVPAPMQTEDDDEA